MATRRYKVSVGEVENQIVEEVGAAVNSDTVELTVDLDFAGAGLRTGEGKHKVLMALELLKAHITKGNWPPA
jgi:hypothetical protein